MLTQIYGLTTPDDAAMVNASGADHVGVVLDEGIETWDSVDEATLRSITAELTEVVVVALSLSIDADRIRRTVDAAEPGIVHLARAAGALSPDDLDALRQTIAPVQLMVTVGVFDASCVDLARAYETATDFLLLDSRDPTSGVVGATGLTHDWTHSAEVVRTVGTPVFLAGGLGPDNVAAAIAAVGPAGVDSETHTSRDDDRRRKDPDRVARFIARAHAAAP